MNRLTLAAVALATLAAACGQHHHSRYDDEPAREPARSSAPSSDDSSDSKPPLPAANTPPSSSGSSGSSGSSSSPPSSSSQPPPPSSSSPPPSSTPPSSDPEPTPPPVPAWHTVVDREMPYFWCTNADQSTFEVEMTTTDAFVVFADNTDVEGTVSIDANDAITFAVGTSLNGTATNAAFAEDMLLSFDVGTTHCDAIAYALDDGFVATYQGTGWDDDLDGEATSTWTLSLGQYGGVSALQDMYFSFDGDEEYTTVYGVYYVDGGVIHVALLNGMILEGNVDASHNIEDTLHGYYMEPSSN